MKLDVIIPFHGRIDMLLRCLKALARTPRIDGIVYLVDDASPPHEAVLARQVLSSLPLPSQWLSLGRRAGFVAAVNYAWSQCQQDASVILNNDTVPTTDLLPSLSAALDRYGEVAAVAPTSDNPADLYQYRPGVRDDLEGPQSLGPIAISVAPYLTGMCLAIRRDAVLEDQLFDPIFSPGYFEDLDLSCRLQARGWRLAILESCRLHHTGRATFGAELHLDAILRRNYSTFSKRWAHLPLHHELDRLLQHLTIPKEQGL